MLWIPTVRKRVQHKSTERCVCFSLQQHPQMHWEWASRRDEGQVGREGGDLTTKMLRLTYQMHVLVGVGQVLQNYGTESQC